MKKLESDGETLDRLSELPESLILHILSFLAMRDVVRTTLLSKSWQYLWTTIPCLKFDSIDSCPVRTRSFVNRVLILWKGTKIRKFEINFRDGSDSSLFSDMDLWLIFAKERNVEELIIRLPSDPEQYWLPHSLYQCSSISSLTLFRCNLRILGNVQWDQLKKLTIFGLNITEDVMNKVVAGTPRLDFICLIFWGSFRNLSIRSSSLKWLYLSSLSDRDPSKYKVLTIWAPNLRALTIVGARFSKCLITDVSSLTFAKLDSRDKWATDQDGESKSQILPAIQHVETLELSAYYYKMLGVMKRKCSFTNVKLLRINSHPIEPNTIVGLLNNFPKLQTLVVDWKLDAEKQDIRYPSRIVASKANILPLLRIAKIIWYSYEASIFQFVEHLLKHAPVIEKMVIEKRGSVLVESEAAQKVVCLQRSFPTVELMILCRN